MEAITTGPRDQRRCRVLGIPIDVCRDVSAAAIGLHSEGGGQIVTLNAEMTMNARRDSDLGAVIEDADLVVPDGAGVVWALGRQGVKVRRSPGIELAWSLLTYAAAHGWRVALVGASPDVMERLLDRLSAQLPDLQLVFAEHGYQQPSHWPLLEARLQSFRPDQTSKLPPTPIQSPGNPCRWRQDQSSCLGTPSATSTRSGLKQRAPEWTSRLQLEWLYRLFQEPSRWRRYLVLPRFVWAVLRHGEQRS